MPLVTVVRDGLETSLDAAGEESLALALFRAGFFQGLPLCSGLGRCGRCRVRYQGSAPEPTDRERDRLDPDDLARGWRLSCLRPPAEGQWIVVPPADRADMAARRVSLKRPEARGPFLLGLDLGTTSYAWRAFDAEGTAAEGRGLNPQMGAGGEIMSRLAFARAGGAGLLARLATDLVREILAGLPGPVSRLALAANPAMTCLALGLDASGLMTAPYRLDFRGGTEASLAPDLPPVLVPPLWGPFLGGDVSAGLASVLASPEAPGYPFAYADLGTNGEFVLALAPDVFLAASAPMGPALEGVGPRHGRLAGPGVAVGYDLTPLGLTPLYYDGGPDGGPAGPDNATVRPAGISGGGYVSLLAALRRVGALDASGGFADRAGGGGITPLTARILSGLTRGREPVLALPDGLALHASDVEDALKVKAAFNLALSRLLAAAGIAPGQLTALILAGALGRYMAPEDLETLGFLPPGLAARTRAVGNASLDGACLLLADPAAAGAAARLGRRTRMLDLTGGADFLEDFVKRMVLAHVP